MPGAPLIGLTTSYEAPEQKIRREYVSSVAEAGGVPIILPMIDDEALLGQLLESLDGLVVIGGPAITMGLVGDVPADLSPTDPLRTESDLRIVRAVLATPKPILGICYGMQLLNALAGGTIYADVQKQVPGTMVHSASRGGTVHPARVERGTRLHALLGGRDEVEVNTVHIQAVAEVGGGDLSAPRAPGGRLRVNARAPDGVVEGLESEDGRVMALQFHPERLGADIRVPLFRDLVQRAAAFRASRS
eukprot:tig00020930_g16040.t1